jgi:hypothetical protein
MSHISARDYEEFHESRESLCPHDDKLTCNGCGKAFTPTEDTMQKDDWCLCELCTPGMEVVEEMCK